jgi:hypothetical protein
LVSWKRYVIRTLLVVSYCLPTYYWVGTTTMSCKFLHSCYTVNVIRRYVKRNPVTGLSWPRGWVVSTTPRPLYPQERPGYPLYRRMGGPQRRAGRVGKISPPPGFFKMLFIELSNYFHDKQNWRIKQKVSVFLVTKVSHSVRWVESGELPGGERHTTSKYLPTLQLRRGLWYTFHLAQRRKSR